MVAPVHVAVRSADAAPLAANAAAGESNVKRNEIYPFNAKRGI